MESINIIKEKIEILRNQLNELVESGEKGHKVLHVSQQLDELVLEYYRCLGLNKTAK